MINKKSVVKVNRSGTRYAEYVRRIDRTPIQTTTDCKLALVMDGFTAEDAIKYLIAFGSPRAWTSDIPLSHAQFLEPMLRSMPTLSL